MGVSASAIHADHALLAQGWARNVRMEIETGRIISVVHDVPARKDDERATILLPGMPNLHSHAFQRGMAGLAERRGPVGDSFWTWRETMYRFVRALEPDGFCAVAAMAQIEMLERGFTHVGEFHYLHHDLDGRPYANPAEMALQLAEAASMTGIGLTLLPVFYAQGGFGGTAPAEGQKRFVNDASGFARLFEASRAAIAPLLGSKLGIAPHSLRAVTPEQLEEILQLAKTGPIHIHIAEQAREVDECIAWSGRRPVEWLLEQTPVDCRWCLVHATHITDAETGALARSGAVAGLCPITEANLGDGVFPMEAFAAAGGTWGIGSDSNVRIDSAEELRLLEYGQRLTKQARNVAAATPGSATGASLYRHALRGGAQALGIAAGFEVGACADAVSLRGDDPVAIGRTGDDWLDALVFAAHDMIDCVWRAGILLVVNGRHIRRPETERIYRQHLLRLLA